MFKAQCGKYPPDIDQTFRAVASGKLLDSPSAPGSTRTILLLHRYSAT